MKRTKQKPEYRVARTAIRHLPWGAVCRAWHAYAGSVQVGGCFRTKAEAVEELKRFIAGERAALGSV